MSREEDLYLMLHYHAGIPWSDYKRSTPIADVKAACQLACAMGLTLDSRSRLAFSWDSSDCFPLNRNPADLWGVRIIPHSWPFWVVRWAFDREIVPKMVQDFDVPDGQVWLYQRPSASEPDMVLHVLGSSSDVTLGKSSSWSAPPHGTPLAQINAMRRLANQEDAR